MRKTSILFLCSGNSCRSQMAEGFAHALRSDVFTAKSAGTTSKGVDPRAVAVMAEADVDISLQHSKTTAELAGTRFDVVVTLCSGAADNCPTFPAEVKIMHSPFDDPPALAAGLDDADALEVYRRVRDRIREFVLDLTP